MTLLLSPPRFPPGLKLQLPQLILPATHVPSKGFLLHKEPSFICEMQQAATENRAWTLTISVHSREKESAPWREGKRQYRKPFPSSPEATSADLLLLA